MEEIEQSMLVLFHGNPKLVDVPAKVIDLGALCHMPHVLQILEGAADFGSVAFGLSSDIGQRRLSSCT